MKKVYFNTFNNIALIINDKAKTITTSKVNKLGDLKDCFTYHVSMTRIKEVFTFYRNSQFKRA